MTTTTLLRQGNKKVGPNIFTWSLPAISTCPGRTDHCESICYADSGFYRMPSVAAGLIKRWELAEQRDKFVAMLSGELAGLQDGTVVRIHASGDFFSPQYVDTWIELVKMYPKLMFYAYTRSWRVKDIRARLNVLRKLANCRVWASTDVETGRAPKGWLEANVADEFAEDGIACMEQTGAKVNCGTCGLCWKVRVDRPVKLSFRTH